MLLLQLLLLFPLPLLLQLLLLFPLLFQLPLPLLLLLLLLFPLQLLLPPQFLRDLTTFQHPVSLNRRDIDVQIVGGELLSVGPCFIRP